jgi:prophage antirepressor-like protein
MELPQITPVETYMCNKTPINVYRIDNQLWIPISQVAQACRITNVTHMLRNVEPNDRRQYIIPDRHGRPQLSVIVNYVGLHIFLIRSRNEIAQEILAWLSTRYPELVNLVPQRYRAAPAPNEKKKPSNLASKSQMEDVRAWININPQQPYENNIAYYNRYAAAHMHMSTRVIHSRTFRRAVKALHPPVITDVTDDITQ